jgi:hypothetical protein
VNQRCFCSRSLPESGPGYFAAVRHLVFPFSRLRSSCHRLKTRDEATLPPITGSEGHSGSASE